MGPSHMKIISHRGYEYGEDPEIENKPSQIEKLLNTNLINVEVDVLYKNRKRYLGHDYSRYEVDIDFLKRDGLWCHAKNVQALEVMLENSIHCFWHQEDDYTLTSKGFIWNYPGKLTNSKKSVFLFPERYPDVDISNYSFICTDYIHRYLEGE